LFKWYEFLTLYCLKVSLQLRILQDISKNEELLCQATLRLKVVSKIRKSEKTALT